MYRTKRVFVEFYKKKRVNSNQRTCLAMACGFAENLQVSINLKGFYMLTCKTMLQNISKGQSSIPLRYILVGLESDYAKLKPNIHLLYIKPDIQSVTMYYKAPSSTFKTLMYDVVLQFFGHDIVKIDTNTQFKVYCNSPSFYFRYANTFKKHGSLLFTEKYPAMVDDDAKIRNPTEVSGFDKYVYSCLFICFLFYQQL